MMDQDVQSHDGGKTVVSLGRFALEEEVELFQVDGRDLFDLERELWHCSFRVELNVAGERNLVKRAQWYLLTRDLFPVARCFVFLL